MPPAPLFFPLLELPPSRGALSAFLACWGEKKKNKLVDVFHLEFVSLSLPLSFFIHPPPICLGRTETKKMKEKNKKNPKHKHFSVSSEKHTYTRHSPQLAAPGCGRRGLCDGGRPAGHALNTPTVLQRRGAGKGEAWENTEASKQQPVTRPTTHTLHYCPDTITMHKGGKSPSGRAPEHSQKKSHCKKKYNNNNNKC